MIHAVIIGHNVITHDLGGFCGVSYGDTAISKVLLQSPSADVKNLRLVECFAIERIQSGGNVTKNVRIDASVVRTEDRDDTINGCTIPGVAVVMKIHNNAIKYADDVIVVFAAR